MAVPCEDYVQSIERIGQLAQSSASGVLVIHAFSTHPVLELLQFSALHRAEQSFSIKRRHVSLCNMILYIWPNDLEHLQGVIMEDICCVYLIPFIIEVV